MNVLIGIRHKTRVGVDEYTYGCDAMGGCEWQCRDERAAASRGGWKQALYKSFHVVSIPPTHCVCRRSFTLHCVDRGIESSEKKIAAHILWSPPQLLL